MVAGHASQTNHFRASKGNFSFSKGAKDASNRRPGTASTVDSFTSALNSPSQVKADLPTPRSSISSTSYSHFDQANRERRFEDMLASGETHRLSESHERSSERISLPAKSAAFKADRQESEASSRRTHLGPGEGTERGQGVLEEDEKENLEEEHDEAVYSEDEANAFQAAVHSPLRQTAPQSRQGGPGIPRRRLPVHPLSRVGSSQESDIAASADSYTTPAWKEKRKNSGRPTSTGSAGLTPTQDSQLFPSPSPSHASEFTVTSIESVRSNRERLARPAVTTVLPDSESSRSQATFTASEILNESQMLGPLHLDKGTNSSSAALSEKSGSALRQRIRKTGGFLKRLGGGSSSEKNRLNTPAGAKVMRKTSQSSLFSESGAGIANSAKSTQGDDYQSRWEQGSTSVPVPSIPTKFKSSNSNSQVSAQRGEKVATSLADGRGRGRESLAAMRTKHAAPASADGSIGSASTEMKHALEAWEQEMDATLQQSGQDLAAKTKVSIPPRNWTPSPQLPEYKVLSRQKSFMDEGDDIFEQRGAPSSGIRGKSSLPSDDRELQSAALSQHSKQYLSPSAQSKPQRSASLGLGLPSMASLKLGATVDQAASPLHTNSVSSDESSRFRKNRSRDEDASYVSYASFASAKSFETAIDRPSFFERHARGEEGKDDANDVALDLPRRRITDSSQELNGNDDFEPGKSVRLIPHNSSESEQEIPSSSHMSHASESRSTGTSPQRVVSATHAKDGTMTQDDNSKQRVITADMVKFELSVSKSSMEEESLAKELAKKCWSEDDTFKRKEKIAEWLGGYASVNRSACRFYMAFFDFTALRIDLAFRKLCDKLFLRAETQQIDRILSAFGQRYFDCNPNTKSILLNADVVHALVFSILLLNTDLHVAEMQDRMTRNQFVRNTLAAMLECNDDLPASKKLRDYSTGQQTSFNHGSDNADESGLVYTEQDQASGRNSSSAQRKSFDAMSLNSAELPRTPSQTTHALSPGKEWEMEMENLLKDVYQAIKNDQIRLPMGEVDSANALRAPKTLRAGSDRVNALKRGSIRGIQGLLGSNTSYTRPEDSPTVSRTSLNSTQRSQSDSFTGVSTPSTSLVSTSSHGVPLSLGFANTLSQSIIKEAKDEDDCASLNSANDDPSDDELALMGPPWAKEGILTRKHYWEAPHRRAKDKSWTNCFVVVQRGVFSMFKFGEGANSTNSQAAAVGGGNWLSNATCIGEMSLAHTVANALPPPGYNRARPHVFALTLPDGCVYFYQTGHEDLLQEWVSTCNYWAARQSKVPLAGGVSNMEYGWNRVMPTDTVNVHGEDDLSIGHASPIGSSRPSMNNANSDTRSIRSGKSSKSMRIRSAGSNFLHSRGGGGQDGRPPPAVPNASPAADNSRLLSSMRTPAGFNIPLERPAYINEWRAPAPPTISSTLNEEDQLESCTRYKARVEAELAEHRALRQPMLAYMDSLKNTTSNASIAKAIANFDRKESYLANDLSKFTLYSMTLLSANKLKAEKRDARSLNRMMRKADEDLARVKEGED